VILQRILIYFERNSHDKRSAKRFDLGFMGTMLLPDKVWREFAEVLLRYATATLILAVLRLNKAFTFNHIVCHYQRPQGNSSTLFWHFFRTVRILRRSIKAEIYPIHGKKCTTRFLWNTQHQLSFGLLN
jgi:hypothetical protein